jgi:hypothetical protein
MPCWTQRWQKPRCCRPRACWQRCLPLPAQSWRCVVCRVAPVFAYPLLHDSSPGLFLILPGGALVSLPNVASPVAAAQGCVGLLCAVPAGGVCDRWGVPRRVHTSGSTVFPCTPGCAHTHPRRPSLFPACPTQYRRFRSRPRHRQVGSVRQPAVGGQATLDMLTGYGGAISPRTTPPSPRFCCIAVPTVEATHAVPATCLCMVPIAAYFPKALSLWCTRAAATVETSGECWFARGALPLARPRPPPPSPTAC